MKEDFEGALKFVLEAEGGFTDDPDDPGGATNDGIEQTEYDVWRKDLHETLQSVKNITLAEVSTIYRTKYWDAVHGDFLVPKVAYVMFDSAVNNGVGTAIRFMSEVLGVPPTYTFDNTLSQVYHAWFDKGHTDLELAHGILTRRTMKYTQLVVTNPRLSKFLDGWLNRIDSLSKLIVKLP